MTTIPTLLRTQESLQAKTDELAQSISRLRATLESTTDGILVVGEEGDVSDYNENFVEMWRLRPEAKNERVYAALLDAMSRQVTDASAFLARIEEIDRAAAPDSVDVLELSDGRAFERYSKTQVVDARTVGRVWTFRDITERRRADAALRKSEQFSRTIIESSGDCAKTLSLDGKLLWMNESGQRALGITDIDAVIGKSWLDFWKGEDRAAAQAALEAAVAGRPGHFVGCYAVRDVPRFWDVVVTPILDADGKPEMVLAVSRDVTERRRQEETLRSETRFLELLNEIGTALAAELDLEKLVQLVTDAGTQLSGAKFGAFFHTLQGAQGEALLLYTLSGAPREAFEGFGLPRATPIFKPILYGEGPVRCDDVLKDPRYGRLAPHYGMPPGHPPVRSFVAVSVVSRTREVIGGLFYGHPEPGVFTERTERLLVGLAGQAAVAIDNARLLERAQRERKRAEEASQEKDEFLAIVSHELRTPLTAILGWSRLLRGGTLTPEKRERGLASVERNALNQSQLIEDLLDVSRIVSGKLRLDVQPVDFVSIVEAAVESAHPAMVAKQIRLRSVLGPGKSDLMGDPTRLQQIVWNLLSNATKFTPRGGSIDITMRRVDSQIELSVSDTGQGIDAAFLPRIFERFKQADASTTRAHGGLGLGLSISKNLVEMHGGTIEASSAGEGRGAMFVVRFPVSPLREPLYEDAHEEDTSMTGRRQPKDVPRELDGLHVLVVDDEADSRELVAILLADFGCRVVQAASMNEALKSMEPTPPDVILSDIGMPGGDGYSLISAIRSMPAARGGNTPAASLTAYAGSEDRRRALLAGFNVHVAKPVDPQELVSVVASLARLGSAMR
ncbi:MAG TPA: ATP-binding protein [Labilithrix sp.]|nr:ATP-binding protein [Labilithrix sp.]